MLNEKQQKSLSTIWKKIVKTGVSAEDWGWTATPDATPYYDGPLFKTMDRYEVDPYATTSCRPPLWVLRAFANRMLITVPQCDWWFYNMRGE